MKIKRKKTFLILTIGIALTASHVLAQARFGPRRGPMAPGQSPGGILMILKAKKEELKVTDEQLEMIKDLMITQQEKALKLQNNQSEISLELRKLMIDRANLDYSRLKQVLTKLSDNRNDMFIERLKDRDAIQSVLTPEQQEGLKSLRTRAWMKKRGLSRRRVPNNRGPARNPDRPLDLRRDRFREDTSSNLIWH